MTAIRSGASSPSSPITTPITEGHEATTSRPASPAPVPQAPPPLPRPKGKLPQPMASSFQTARFSELAKPQVQASTVNAAAVSAKDEKQAAWHKAHSVLDAAINTLKVKTAELGPHDDLACPENDEAPSAVLAVREASKQAVNAFNETLATKDIKTATPAEQSIFAQDFLKLGLAREHHPEFVKPLDALYNSLPSIAANDPKTAKALIPGLMTYGVGYLGEKDKFSEGMNSVVAALEVLTKAQQLPQKGESYANSRDELLELQTLASQTLEKCEFMCSVGAIQQEVLDKADQVSIETGKAVDKYKSAVVKDASAHVLSPEQIQDVVKALRCTEDREDQEALGNAVLKGLKEPTPAKVAQFIADIKAATLGVEDMDVALSALRKVIG